MVLFHVYNIGNKDYLYDIHSGNIVSIDKNVYQVLEDIELNKTIKLYTEVREINDTAFDYLNNF